jgi:hypothetical protein
MWISNITEAIQTQRFHYDILTVTRIEDVEDQGIY